MNCKGCSNETVIFFLSDVLILGKKKLTEVREYCTFKTTFIFIKLMPQMPFYTHIK